MTYKLDEKMTRERFAELCAYMTRKQIAEHLDITIWSVVHYEKRFNVKPQSAHRRPSAQRFAWLAERHTKAEVARICGVSYAAVVHWEDAYGIRCRTARVGRQPGQKIIVTAPYRLNWLVQGGVWEDLRQCGGDRV